MRSEGANPSPKFLVRYYEMMMVYHRNRHTGNMGKIQYIQSVKDGSCVDKMYSSNIVFAQSCLDRQFEISLPDAQIASL